MLKNCLLFVGGCATGAYLMYNKIYRMIAAIAINGAATVNKPDKAETEETDN